MLKGKTTFWFLVEFVRKKLFNTFRPMLNKVVIHHECPFQWLDCSDAFHSFVTGAAFLQSSEAGKASKRRGTNRSRCRLKCKCPKRLRILQKRSHGKAAFQSFSRRQRVRRRRGMQLHTRAMVKRKLNCATKDN